MSGNSIIEKSRLFAKDFFAEPTISIPSMKVSIGTILLVTDFCPHSIRIFDRDFVNFIIVRAVCSTFRQPFNIC